MTNCLFGFPVYSDVGVTYTPALSGGSWEAALPLTNLQDRRLHYVARSTDAAVASTQLDVDLGVARAVRLIALANHNGSTAALGRALGMSSPLAFYSQTVGDSSWLKTGTPTRTPAAFSCADGVALDLVGDDDAGVVETTEKLVVFAGDGVKAIRFRIAKSSSYTQHIVLLNDQTVLDDRLWVNIDFTGATPSVVSGGSGVIVSTTARGDGSFDVLCTTDAITAANTHRLRVYPAGAAAGDTAQFYVGDFMVWDATTDQFVYDSGLTGAYPSGLDAETVEGMPLDWVDIPSAAQTARYWHLFVEDTANGAGYVELGRLVIAGGWQPTVNLIDQGGSLGLGNETTREATDGGAAVYARRPVRRSFTGTLGAMGEDEVLTNLFDMQRIAGTDRQFYWVYNPEDTTHLHRRSFLAVFRELSAFEYATLNNYGVPIALVEEL